MMPRRLALSACVLAVALVAAIAAATTEAAGASVRLEVTVTAPDGTPIAATLVLPDGEPPAGGWPAIVFLHGLAGTRAQGLAIADAMAVGPRYAVLAFDARGHGASGGKVGLDGPNEVADTRAVFEWLRDRPEVSDTRIGGFGISYGGGALLNSLTAGVPWAAAEVAITFSDLTRALYPQRLAKSGVVAGFVAALDAARVDPVVTSARDAAYAGDTSAVTTFGGPRSSIKGLGGVRTPVYVMQGRRDFAFDLDQGLPAFKALGGPKKLWIGNIGHVVSSFPGPDTPAMLGDGRRWFDRFLLGEQNGVDRGPAVTVAGEGSSRTTALATVPATARTVFRSTKAQSLPSSAARGSWTLGPTARTLEVFGAPAVTIDAIASGGWSRIVAVLTARVGAAVKVVAVGGARVRQGSSKALVRLISTATVVPRGSKLTLTLAASSSVAAGTAGLTYLDLPLPEAARLTVRTVSVSLPVLKTPIAR